MTVRKQNIRKKPASRIGGPRPGSGRKKGSLNVNRQELLDLCRKATGNPEYNPVVEMAKISMDPANEISTRLQAGKEVAQYLYPKLRMIEAQVDADMAGEMVIRWAQPKD